MDALTPPPDVIQVWDIVRVDFPFADQAATRRRPALVIATLPATDAFSVLWALMITSANRGLWPLDVEVSDIAHAGLPHGCVVRPGKVATFDARLAERIGSLAPADRLAIVATLRTILGPILPP